MNSIDYTKLLNSKDINIQDVKQSLHLKYNLSYIEVDYLYNLVVELYHVRATLYDLVTITQEYVMLGLSR